MNSSGSFSQGVDFGGENKLDKNQNSTQLEGMPSFLILPNPLIDRNEQLMHGLNDFVYPGFTPHQALYNFSVRTAAVIDLPVLTNFQALNNIRNNSAPGVV